MWFCDKGKIKPIRFSWNIWQALVSLGEFELKCFQSLNALPVRYTSHRIQTSWYDTLYQHALRPKFQAGMWKCCLDANLSISKPNCYEWSVDNAASSITTTRLTGLPAPQSVMDLLRCVCYLACVALNCACITNRLKCAQLGKLQNCNNEE